MSFQRAILGGLALSLAVSFPAVSRADRHCRRVPIADPPTSIAGATWSLDGNSIILLNNGTRSLDVVSLEGRRLSRISSPGGGALDFNSPGGLQRTSSGYVLNDQEQHFLWLDRNLRAFASFDLRRDDGEGDEWFVTSQSEIQGRQAIGVASQSHGDREDYGVVRMQLEPNAGAPKLIESIPMPPGRRPHAGPTWRFYAYTTVFSRSYLVRVEDRVFWLRVKENLGLELVEYRAGRLRTLPVVPAAYAQWPRTLPEEVTFDEIESIGKQIERATMISQLLTDGRRLYLLGHTPAPRGQRWTLFAVNAAGTSIDFQRELPTTAANILVLPGERETAILEIATIHGLERRPKSLLLLGNDWLGAPGSPKLVEAACAPSAR